MLALAVAATGCSDSPTDPSPTAELVASPVTATALLRSAVVGSDLTVTADIGPEGGTFEIPGAGLKVIVPAHAVDEVITFTAKAIAGDVIAYEFGPHGTQFRRPLLMEQDLSLTGWEQLGRPGNMEVGYFEGSADVDLGRSEVRVKEFLPVIVDHDQLKAYFRVRHFSGYMLSTGRRNSTGSAGGNVAVDSDL